MQNEGKKHRDSNTKSISKSLAILDSFQGVTTMQRTSDIAQKLGMNVSTASRHLNTMLDWGFLERDENTGFYYPGLKIISLAGVALQNNEVYRHCYPELQAISDEYNIHSHMGIPKGNDIVHMINNSSEQTRELMIPMGHTYPMYCSAMGRSILAYLPPNKIQDILKTSNLVMHASETKVNIEDILQTLEHVRKRGYCLILNELTERKASIAAPIYDRDRNPVASISVSASVRRLSIDEEVIELSRAITNAARRVSGKLGYYPK